jgi:DNA-binding XRE family transcriptional regulator
VVRSGEVVQTPFPTAYSSKTAISECNCFSKSQTFVGTLSVVKISPAQCRGARGMLGWSQAELAEAAGVSRPTIVDFERGARVPHAGNLASIVAAFEQADIEFTPENGAGAGVRFRKASASK